MKKNILTLTALILTLALMLAGCGSKAPAETTAPTAAENSGTAALPAALGLKEAQLTASTWSSPNGATVHLTATPAAYSDGDTASFVVRLESEEVANVPCQWDGKHFTAEAELNAADGLCYYVVMTGTNGNTAELAINTPTQPTDEALINLESALSAYCSILVEGAAFDSGKLIITSGTVQVQAPRITDGGKAITCQEALLILSLHGEELDRETLKLEDGDATGDYALSLSDISFNIPELENDQQLVLTLNVTLSNGQTLTDAGSTFYYNDGNVMAAVG